MVTPVPNAPRAALTKNPSAAAVTERGREADVAGLCSRRSLGNRKFLCTLFATPSHSKESFGPSLTSPESQRDHGREIKLVDVTLRRWALALLISSEQARDQLPRYRNQVCIVRLIKVPSLDRLAQALH